MKIPDITELNKSLLRVEVFKKRYSEFYSFLVRNYDDCKTLSEKLYLYYNELSERPKCIICESPVGFDGLFKGFRKYCCRKCSRRGPESNFKRDQTNLKKYGAKNPFSSEIIKEKIKYINLKRYNVENPQQNRYIKEKAKQTNLERYGVTCSLLNKSVKEKVEQTNIERYGVGNPFSSDIIKKKIKQIFQQNIINSRSNILRYTAEGGWVCKCPHPECNKCTEKEYVINSNLYNSRKYYNIEPCTKLLPIQSFYSTPELQIRNFLDSLNIKYITNDRSIITPKELDIYIPSKEIAIEFNGSYWHSNKDKYYHQNKTKTCYSKGVLLVHIYEHEWNNDKESVLSKLKDILDDKEVDGIVPVKDYDKYTLSEPVLIDCGSYKIWNEGIWLKK